MLLMLAGFVFMQAQLLHYLSFDDENETVVACKMMASGQRLYSEIYNNHGPMTFFSGYWLEKLGDFSVPQHRLPIAALQLLILALAFFTPLAASRYARAAATVVMGLSLAFVAPKFWGHMNQYDTMAGCLLAIASLVYIVPSILEPRGVSNAAVALGSFLIGTAAFFAVTYWPALGLLFLAALRPGQMRRSVFWLVLAVLANLVFLGAVGSLGGYVAYHFYFNLVVLPPFMGTTFLNSLQRIAAGINEYRWIGLCFFLVMVWMLRRAPQAWWRVAFLLLACLAFYVRGVGFHGLAGHYVLLAALGLCMAQALGRARPSQGTYALAALALLLALPFLSAHFVRKYRADTFPLSSPFAKLARQFTQKGERVLAYNNSQLYQYLLADRLPASGQFFYLPAQAKYNQAPFWGFKIDPCQQIEGSMPKIMLIDHCSNGDDYRWEDYTKCIQALTAARYQQLPGESIYVRKDLLSEDPGIVPSKLPLAMLPVAGGGPGQLLVLSPAHQHAGLGLKRLGILLSAQGGPAKGQAELRLQDPHGAAFAQRFSLKGLGDREYHFFDLPPARYQSGQLRADPGSALSLGQSSALSVAGQPCACLAYEYEDGRHRYTPGCPLY